MSLLRTFIAIETSAEVRHGCNALIRKLNASEVKANWTRTENLHHTLKFLGDTSDKQLANVCRAMARAAATVEPFVLESVGAGAFPRLTSPRVVWIGAGAGAESMIALHEAIDQELYEVGFALEARRFTPHVSLGRIRKNGGSLEPLTRLLELHHDFHAGATHVDEVILFSSSLTKSGPTYEVLGRAALGSHDA